MEAVSVSECSSCPRIILPGEEIFLHRADVLCSRCHREVSVQFAGLSLCH
jgi:hypothetical protein